MTYQNAVARLGKPEQKVELLSEAATYLDQAKWACGCSWHAEGDAFFPCERHRFEQLCESS